ncbi:DUF397 domain-containing protein [Actinopolyspora halophila]|uniref:DUF397 domain-containing protein n=1 Tax=Actinopolyspora halophila TaxID=1850 RepID=UPI00036DC13F|nr:DUF397 domain-containing protein [Actinopolyspora halophila]
MTEPSAWRKSTYTQQETACVEIGRLGSGAAVRDTKDRTGGYFTTGRAQWRAFIQAVKTDRFA